MAVGPGVGVGVGVGVTVGVGVIVGVGVGVGDDDSAGISQTESILLIKLDVPTSVTVGGAKLGIVSPPTSEVVVPVGET